MSAAAEFFKHNLAKQESWCEKSFKNFDVYEQGKIGHRAFREIVYATFLVQDFDDMDARAKQQQVQDQSIATLAVANTAATNAPGTIDDDVVSLES